MTLFHKTLALSAIAVVSASAVAAERSAPARAKAHEASTHEVRTDEVKAGGRREATELLRPEAASPNGSPAETKARALSLIEDRAYEFVTDAELESLDRASLSSLKEKLYNIARSSLPGSQRAEAEGLRARVVVRAIELDKESAGDTHRATQARELRHNPSTATPRDVLQVYLDGSRGFGSPEDLQSLLLQKWQAPSAAFDGMRAKMGRGEIPTVTAEDVQRLSPPELSWLHYASTDAKRGLAGIFRQGREAKKLLTVVDDEINRRGAAGGEVSQAMYATINATNRNMNRHAERTHDYVNDAIVDVMTTGRVW